MCFCFWFFQRKMLFEKRKMLMKRNKMMRRRRRRITKTTYSQTPKYMCLKFPVVLYNCMHIHAYTLHSFEYSQKCTDTVFWGAISIHIFQLRHARTRLDFNTQYNMPIKDRKCLNPYWINHLMYSKSFGVMLYWKNGNAIFIVLGIFCLLALSLFHS